MLKNTFSAFVTALMLLTRIPLPVWCLPNKYDGALKSYAVLYYPLVGGIIGCLLLLPVLLSAINGSEFIISFLILFLWVAITGGLHIDGLSDSADAYFASHKDKKITLEVFHDPHTGAMGVIAIVLCLLGKYVFIYSYIQSGLPLYGIVFAPMLARLLAVLYMLLTPYARETGIAEGIQLDSKKTVITSLVLGVSVVAWLFLSVKILIAAVILLSILLYFWRSMWLKIIGGYTGDLVGGLIEISECCLLCLFCLVFVY